MSVMHLTEERLGRLLDGTLDRAEARELARHLAEPCQACEALLADRPGADALDGLVDAALTALAPPDPAQAGNDLEFARILELARVERAARRGRRRLRLPLAAAAAVALLAAGVVWRAALDRRPDPATDGMKAPKAVAVPVRLRFLAVRPRPSGAEVEKGIPGMSLPAEASLQFQLEVSLPADAALVRVDPSGQVDVFWHERVTESRPFEIAVAGRPAVYPLAGLAGPQRILLLASPGPLARERVVAAARALAPPARIGGDRPELEGLSVDTVEVTVR